MSTMKKLNRRHLFQWAVDKGINIRGLTTKTFQSSGRGVMTTRFINIDEVFLSMPRDLLITFDTVLSSFTWMSREKGVRLTAKDLFILFLVVEMRKSRRSSFRIYLQSVPRQYTTPCYIPIDEKHLLPSFILEVMEKQLATIQQHFLRLEGAIHSFPNKFSIFHSHKLREEEVKWAWNVVNTRSVYFDPHDLLCSLDSFVRLKEVDFALAPLLDMLNHKSEAKVFTFFTWASEVFGGLDGLLPYF